MAPAKEAKARIKINKLLEEAGWRFFDDENGKANILLEPHVKTTQTMIDELGENFEKAKNGFIDFLLVDEQTFPLVTLEAKSEDKSPLVGKEQARTYAKSQNCRFIILSNGNVHYFWDLEQGNPHLITKFPSPESIKQYLQFTPNPTSLAAEPVELDYIALSQMPGYLNEAGWKSETERQSFIEKNRLRFFRDYQLKAIHAVQAAVKGGSSRFLLEMATGTGKTLVATAICKLFLRTGNARRVLFLVDRLELEDQAYKALNQLLKNDYTAVIYKENKGDWHKAEIVITTVQSLLTGAKYKKHFSPTDFDLVISDEAHRSINGNARAVFEYFMGYKLGLTATPKDYLKNKKTSAKGDQRDMERRLLLDTYRTFGCESGEPTFRYSLIDGVKDDFLINPLVVDVRTTITTQLLSEKGYSVMAVTEDVESADQTFYQRDFEKKFFSENTNKVFCETFLDHALRDPVSGEIGKSIVFAVSQNHAAKLAQILNEMAHERFPGKYQSDFAVQVTSLIPEAQQFTINFANNNLMGSANFIDSYRTSKARVCVTVGMMTTGYDCPDLLNLALMRPVFSPSDFIQIKGRGTRKHNFLEQLLDDELKGLVNSPYKTRFKLFDFFATCEYFEEKFNYDEVLKLPQPSQGGGDGPTPPQPPDGLHVSTKPDAVETSTETQVGVEGMRIDRMFFNKFEDKVKADEELKAKVEAELWDQAVQHVLDHHFDKPKEFFNLENLRKAAGVDRRLTVRELIEKALGRITYFKSKQEVLDDEFQKFLMDTQPEESAAEAVGPMRYYFDAYATDGNLRNIIDEGRLVELNVNPSFGAKDLMAVPPDWRTRIPNYIKDYVPLNQFM